MINITLFKFTTENSNGLKQLWTFGDFDNDHQMIEEAKKYNNMDMITSVTLYHQDNEEEITTTDKDIIKLLLNY